MLRKQPSGKSRHNSLRLRVGSNSKGQVELDLCKGGLTSVPAEVFQFTGIQVLRLSDNEIDCLPTMLSYLRGLKHLVVARNLLTSLPETIVNCKHLTELDLTHNRLPSLPRGVGALRMLRSLKVGKNDLEQIPHEIGQLASLRHVDLHQNKLWYLPFSIHHLRKLLYLNLANNLFDQIPAPVCRLTSLHTLNLSQNRLVNLPPGFENLVNLRELNLGENKFISLNTAIVKLRHLKYLNVACNRLTFIPQELTKLQCLRVLHLQGNLLETFPSKFDNLQYLNLAKNQIDSFSVERMRNLVCLNAACNRLDVLPRGIFELSHLKFLRLENNKIHDIPEEIAQLKKLQNLDVSNNCLISVPMSVYKLENLQSFNIKGNTIVNKPTSPPQLFEQKTFGLFRKNKNMQSLSVRPNSIQPSRNSTVRSIKSMISTKSGKDQKRTEKGRNRLGSPEDVRRGRRRSLSNEVYQTDEICAEFSSEGGSSGGGSLRSHRSEPQIDRLRASDDAADVTQREKVNDAASSRCVTDYNLLGVCSQLESLLGKQLLHPVLTLNGSIRKRFNTRTIKKTVGGVWRLSPDSTVTTGSRGVEYSQPETFTVTDRGGAFVSTFDPNIQVNIPANCLSMVAHATLQIMKVDDSILSRLRDVNQETDNLLAIGPIIFLKLLESQLSFNTSVMITIPSPTETKRGHLVLISIREDNSCVPCSSGVKIAKNTVTFNTWNFTGKVAVIAKAKCKYKACKSMEQLLYSLGVKINQE